MDFVDFFAAAVVDAVKEETDATIVTRKGQKHHERFFFVRFAFVLFSFLCICW